jgi:hypothetical protein
MYVKRTEKSKVKGKEVKASGKEKIRNKSLGKNP